jgi:hypothetical protein
LEERESFEAIEKLKREAGVDGGAQWRRLDRSGRVQFGVVALDQALCI